MTKEVLQRKAFSISRLAEFVSESELVKQIGHPVADWPLVIAKELIDNALDEAEEAGTAPSIEIMVESDFHLGQRPWPRHPRRDGREVDQLFHPHIEPRRLCVADPWRAGERATDNYRHAVRARSRAFPSAGTAISYFQPLRPCRTGHGGGRARRPPRIGTTPKACNA